MRRPSRFRRGLLQDTRGAAALEMALWTGILSLPILNVVDLGFYVFQRMQVDEAAQVAAQAAWKLCDQPGKLPAISKCAGLNTTIATALASTSLGSNVTLQSGWPQEGYYCPDAANALQSVVSSTANCSASGYPAGTPGYYLKVAVRFTYSPLFTGVTVAGLLPSPITRTSWMRLD